MEVYYEWRAIEKKNDFNFERSNRAHAKCAAAWSGRRRSQHLHAAGCFLPIPLAFRWKRQMYKLPKPNSLGDLKAYHVSSTVVTVRGWWKEAPRKQRMKQTPSVLNSELDSLKLKKLKEWTTKTVRYIIVLFDYLFKYLWFDMHHSCSLIKERCLICSPIGIVKHKMMDLNCPLKGHFSLMQRRKKLHERS